MEQGVNAEELLSQIVRISGESNTAPQSTIRYGRWYEFTVGIGNDEVAYITMSDYALRALYDRNGIHYKEDMK